MLAGLQVITRSLRLLVNLQIDLPLLLLQSEGQLRVWSSAMRKLHFGTKSRDARHSGQPRLAQDGILHFLCGILLVDDVEVDGVLERVESRRLLCLQRWAGILLMGLLEVGVVQGLGTHQ